MVHTLDLYSLVPSPELLFSSFTDMRPNWASRVFAAMVLVLVWIPYACLSLELELELEYR